LGYHYDFETRIMSNYRRLTIRGGTYFFTVEAYRRQPLFIDDARVERLRHAFREVKAKRPFDVVAVILPNHLHCLWNLPEGDADFSVRWHRIKTSFSRRLPAKIRKDGSPQHRCIQRLKQPPSPLPIIIP
jgi:putative transposase